MNKPSVKSIKNTIQMHDKLNPIVWFDDEMRLEVRIRLLRAAIAFYRFLDIDGLVVRDIVITGSNAAYNYTEESDIDVHLIATPTTRCPALTQNILASKKTLWSETYHVKIHGHPVELYVEDATKPAKSNGVYSILYGRWIKHPQQIDLPKNDKTIVNHVQLLVKQIDKILSSSPTEKDIDHIFNEIRSMRQRSLTKGNEFSTGNLIFKALRSLGYLDKLYNARADILTKDLSL